MKFRNNFNAAELLGKSLIVIATVILVGCFGSGGSASTSAATSAPTAAEVAAITSAQIATYTGAQIAGLGTNIKYLSNAALGALSPNGGYLGQIQSITAAQIVTLSPAQVRLIGAAATGSGGVFGPSQFAYLNTAAWTALVSDPLQVAAITAAEMPTLSDAEITALGTNIKSLTNAALNVMAATVMGSHLTGQVQSISAAQIAALSPAQVRQIGAFATGPYVIGHGLAGGSTGVSLIAMLNAGAWAMLVSDPLQVAAITAAEVSTMSDAEVIALGSNIASLSNTALAAFSPSTAGAVGWYVVGQIQSITAAQIASLSPAQVRFIGAAGTGTGGAFGPSQFASLNTAAWAALVSNSLQVAAITAAEIPYLSDVEVTTLGSNIAFLSNAALGALSPTVAGQHWVGQIQSISAAEVVVLSPAQISVIAGINTNTGISFLNNGAFGSLSAPQIAVLTVAQKASLSAAQHTSCGC